MQTLSTAFLISSSLCLPYLATCRPGTIDCSDSFEPGINVLVLDAQISTGIDHAILTLTEGEYTETLKWLGAPPGTYSGAYERSGTYTLTVEAEGFVSQTIDGIVIGLTEDGCHVDTISLTVELTPTG